MVSSRLKKTTSPLVPSLQLGGHDVRHPRTSGDDGSLGPNCSTSKRKESVFMDRYGGSSIRGASSADTSTRLPVSTPRGTFSYKDVLLTPRMAPQRDGQQTSRASYSVERIGRRSSTGLFPMTARVPSRMNKEQNESRDTGSKGEGVSKLLYQIAKEVEMFERENVEADGEIARSVSKSIQMAASVIGVPAGILDMLQMHEQHRMKGGRPRHPSPLQESVSYTAHLKRIRAKISDIEHALSVAPKSP